MFIPMVLGSGSCCPAAKPREGQSVLALTLASFSAFATLPSSSYSIRHSISMPAMR